MFELEDRPDKPPRFPSIAAALCVACLGAAGWTWMRYSYAWNLSADYIYDRAPQIYEGKWPAGACVQVETARLGQAKAYALVLAGSEAAKPVCVQGKVIGIGTVTCGHVAVEVLEKQWLGGVPSFFGLPGEATWVDYHTLYLRPYVTVGTSRFTGASIAGLVVGAMGVFVFTVALGHWLGERRRFRERDEGA
ncbi:MAG: hypothetical protein ACYTFI_03465 [Planctomycetota bacterium]